MIALKKSGYLHTLQTLLFAVAIFFSLMPFAFGSVSWDNAEGIQWLWHTYPQGAVISGIIGLIGWVGYFLIGSRLRTTSL